MKKSINLLFAVIFLSIVIICIWTMSPQDKKIANIYKNGDIVNTINLDKVNKSYIIDIDGHNEVLVEKGTICMKDADCPDKLCVKQGAISDATYPIVCLPNKVIIKIEGESEFDTVTGK